MVKFCFSVLWVCVILARAKITHIHLLPGGVISEELIKSNLINAYRRFLSSRSGTKIALLLDGELVIPLQNPNDSIIHHINDLDLKRPTADCVNWHIDKMVPESDNYIVTDLNPCNGTQVVSGAKHFVRTHERTSSIVTIGMGNKIHSDWLKQVCGPCGGTFGCMRGWNWFRV